MTQVRTAIRIDFWTSFDEPMMTIVGPRQAQQYVRLVGDAVRQSRMAELNVEMLAALELLAVHGSANQTIHEIARAAIAKAKGSPS